MDDEVTLEFKEIGEITIVCFEMGGYKYFMSSPQGTTLLETFECISSNENLECVSVDEEEARRIWETLVKCGFERVGDLEANVNNKYRDDAVTVYKIRDKATKQYSRGGQSGGRWLWSKKGKSWNQLNHIQSHINQLCHECDGELPEEYKNAELVELGELRATDMTDFDKIKQKK